MWVCVCCGIAAWESLFDGGFRAVLGTRAELAVGVLTIGLPLRAFSLLAPAWIAGAFGRDREVGQREALVLARVRPRAILFARGAACLAPFLALLAAGVLASLGIRLCVGYPLGPFRWPLSALVALRWVMDTALLVTVAGVCRRRPTAMVACHATELLVLPATIFLVLRHVRSAAVPALLEAGVALLGFAAATRSLRYPRQTLP